MSANDILDVLNIQRGETPGPAKKKQRVEQPALQKGGLARELYNLLGPNTPPVNMNMGISRIKDRKQRVSPWTRMPFVPNKKNQHAPTFHHWEKGSKELLEENNAGKPYFFDKFLVTLDIPEMVDEPTFNTMMTEIKEREEQLKKERKERQKQAEQDKKTKEIKKEDGKTEKELSKSESSEQKTDAAEKKPEEKSEANDDVEEDKDEHEAAPEWTYQETVRLFQYCQDFELKWHAVADRFPSEHNRSLEDLKEHFYRMCSKILREKGTGNPSLLESLDAYSKPAEVDRKQYLENLLKRTPAEIAEEESLVIEARRFELAAKKMLVERSHLLTLLDSPQSSQSVQQYQSSQGLTNLYNNLMILDKHQKKKMQQKAGSAAQDPIPPPIPLAASSSYKKDRGYQTHLQQYLSGLLKPPSKGEQPNPVQELLAKRLTQKEEEIYGLHYHANERLTPGVILRSSQRLPGLQQRQSVFKAVNSMLQELDIPTSGGTAWKPNMPTRKTMAKYDELVKAVVALLDVKKGKDKLEAEIELIKSQRGLQ